MRHLRPGQTLQATALVHEAWSRLCESGEDRAWESRQHFLSVATMAIRNLVVDQVRARHRLKRGGGKRREALRDDLPFALPEVSDDVKLAVSDALEELRADDPRAADIVAFRFFLGMSEPECAATLEVSERTVRRDWTYARAWLAQRLGGLFSAWDPQPEDG